MLLAHGCGFRLAVKPELVLMLCVRGGTPLLGSRENGGHPARDEGPERAGGMAALCSGVAAPARSAGERVALGLAVKVGDPGLSQIVLDCWVHVSRTPRWHSVALSRGCG
jgi:hypothetical protein